MKKCSKCGELKPLELFSTASKEKSGKKSSCKDCEKAYRYANRDRINAQKKLHYAANRKSILENRRITSEERNEKRRKDYADNPLKHQLIQKKWRDAHPVEISERHKKWALNNPEKVKLNNKKRRVQLLNNGVFEISEKFLRKLYLSNCFWCGSKSDINADHVIPISKGGIHSEGNLMPLCNYCNRSKKDKYFSIWRYSQFAINAKERNNNVD